MFIRGDVYAAQPARRRRKRRLIPCAESGGADHSPVWIFRRLICAHSDFAQLRKTAISKQRATIPTAAAVHDFETNDLYTRAINANSAPIVHQPFPNSKPLSASCRLPINSTTEHSKYKRTDSHETLVASTTSSDIVANLGYYGGGSLRQGAIPSFGAPTSILVEILAHTAYMGSCSDR